MVKEKQGASATRVKAQEDWKGAQKKPAAVVSQADTRAQVGWVGGWGVRLGVDAQHATSARFHVHVHVRG